MLLSMLLDHLLLQFNSILALVGKVVNGTGFLSARAG